jgi:HEAT repeat protein
VISVENEKKIRALLDSAQEEERLQGLKELGRCSSGDSAPAIIRALGDESWRVRKEAAELFISLPGGDALTGEIIELLHSEDNAGLRNTAVEILVRLGHLAIPLLLEELSCSDHDVRKFVLDILGEIGDESIVPSMLRALSDPDDNVRAAAAENLGRIGSVESVPALIAALGHSDLWFRFTVLEALGEIGAPVPMDSLLRYKDDRLLRKALFDCLGRFFVCVDDLEDELIRAMGADRVVIMIEREGESGSWRLFQNQPAQRGRDLEPQLRRFMGTKSGRKIRFAEIMARAIDLSRIPSPIQSVINYAFDVR